MVDLHNASVIMENVLTLTMLNLDVPCFVNIVDSDQLASEKPADQDLHCFPVPL